MLNRRQFLAGASLTAAPAQTAAKPNILHVMSDQQQWGTIAGRTECRTPNLNRLAAGGMLFERSYTPSAVCCPARAMMLSGAYHWHNGVFNQVHSTPSVHRDMFPDVVLYSQRLKEAGYKQGYLGKWHASQIRGPLDFGFDENTGRAGKTAQQKGALKSVPTRQMKWPGSEPFTMWGYREGPEEATPEYNLAENTIEMISRFAKGGQPWHIESHFVQPHDAYMPLKKYLDRYDPRAIKVPKSFHDTFQGKPGLHRRESESWGAITEEDYRQSRAYYYAYVEELDAQLGRIFDALEKTGQSDNTLVVYTTDHGDMVGAHRMWIKGWIPYEECYRVPLIIRWPGRIKPGSRTEHLVQTHDLAHTYVQAAGAGKMPYADGRALQPLLENPGRADWADEIMCAYYGGEFLYTQRIAITDRFKYVFNGFDIDELYDLREDPEELHNAAYDPKYRAHADDMRARLYDMMRRFEDPFGDVKPRNDKYGNKPDRYGAPRYLSRGKRI